MSKPVPARPCATPKRTRCGTFKHLHVRLERADDEAIARGLEGLRLLGIAMVRNRSDYLRYCVHEMTRRTLDALRAHAEST